MIKFTPEQREFISKNYKNLGNQELADLVNEKFKTSFVCSQIKSFKNRYHLDSGLTGRFEKGHKTFNKGLKWNDYMPINSQNQCRKTLFKKGNIPSNRRELFEERIDKDGYTEIKIQDGCLKDNWQHKHRYIYEQHCGEIPKGYKIIFLDNDKSNFDINNLKMISGAEELIMNNNKLRYSKQELTETGHLIAQIINKRGQIKK